MGAFLNYILNCEYCILKGVLVNVKYEKKKECLTKSEGS